jgi:hypothetical protein
MSTSTQNNVEIAPQTHSIVQFPLEIVHKHHFIFPPRTKGDFVLQLFKSKLVVTIVLLIAFDVIGWWLNASKLASPNAAIPKQAHEAVDAVSEYVRRMAERQLVTKD